MELQKKENKDEQKNEKMTDTLQSQLLEKLQKSPETFLK